MELQTEVKEDNFVEISYRHNLEGLHANHTLRLKGCVLAPGWHRRGPELGSKLSQADASHYFDMLLA